MLHNSESVPLVFTAQHYAAIGEVVVAFQSLDEVATLALARFIHPEDELPLRALTHLVLNELSFANKIKLLSAHLNSGLARAAEQGASEHSKLWSSDFSSATEGFRKALLLASQAESSRNQLVHSHWAAWPLAGPFDTVHRSKVRTTPKKIVITREYVAAKQISEIATIAKEATKLLQRAYTELHYLVRELPST